MGKDFNRGSNSGLKAQGSAFTGIELLVAIAIITMLAAMPVPVLAHAKEIGNLNNLRQSGIMFQVYADDNNDIFAAHSNVLWLDGPNVVGAGSGIWSLHDRWRIIITDPTEEEDNHLGNMSDRNNTSQLFHDPVLTGVVTAQSWGWHWQFYCHCVVYGYNGYLLEVYPCVSAKPPLDVAEHPFANMQDLKRLDVRLSVDCLLISDRNPPPPDGLWSNIFWSSTAGMHPNLQNDRSYNEHINAIRRLGMGNAMFVDGSAEARHGRDINSQTPTAAAYFSLKNSQDWIRCNGEPERNSQGRE